MMTDPIADMLTRIRNANAVYKTVVEMPHSNLKEKIAKKLKEEGYIKDYVLTKQAPQSKLTVHLKYGPDGERLIREITRTSRPGCRIYQNVQNMPKILRGLGISLISTSQGIMTDKECREKKIGGEVLCTVW